MKCHTKRFVISYWMLLIDSLLHSWYIKYHWKWVIINWFYYLMIMNILFKLVSSFERSTFSFQIWTWKNIWKHVSKFIVYSTTKCLAATLQWTNYLLMFILLCHYVIRWSKVCNQFWLQAERLSLQPKSCWNSRKSIWTNFENVLAWRVFLR